MPFIWTLAPRGGGRPNLPAASFSWVGGFTWVGLNLWHKVEKSSRWDMELCHQEYDWHDEQCGDGEMGLKVFNWPGKWIGGQRWETRVQPSISWWRAVVGSVEGRSPRKEDPGYWDAAYMCLGTIVEDWTYWGWAYLPLNCCQEPGHGAWVKDVSEGSPGRGLRGCYQGGTSSHIKACWSV